MGANLIHSPIDIFSAADTSIVLCMYAVARFVAKEHKSPNMLLLQPMIEAGFECLYDIELPFSEDIRSYKFPPLPLWAGRVRGNMRAWDQVLRASLMEAG